MKKAVFETTKKKEIGVSDLTLLSKVSNEAINDNLKLRFENREIYVGVLWKGGVETAHANATYVDVYRPCVGLS